MKWGKEQATKEKVPLGLTSSTMGSGLYLKQGFKRYSTLRVEGFPGGDVPVFLWEPTELEGTYKAQRDFQTADAPIKETIMLGETPQLLRI